jgi:hypothetical protein
MCLELAYIAGFLDCDGTIVIVRATRGGNEGFRYYGKICFYSQNLSVLRDIQAEVGGNIPPVQIDVYMLQLCPRETVVALKRLSPYLRIKREQAETVIELHRMIDATHHPRNKGLGGGGAKRLDESVYAARQVLYERMRELNHKDSKAFRTNRVNSVELLNGETIPSQAAEGEGSAEGVTTREVSPNNNPLHEPPARKGRDSLSSTDSAKVN